MGAGQDRNSNKPALHVTCIEKSVGLSHFAGEVGVESNY